MEQRSKVRVSMLVLAMTSAGCGGRIADHPGGESSTAEEGTLDASNDGGTDSDRAVEEAADAPTCALLGDPCFHAWAVEKIAAIACFGHEDLCVTTGGADPSGCGLVSSGPPDYGSSCRWPDGARLDILKMVNAEGEVCADGNVESVGAYSVVFPDGHRFEFVEGKAGSDEYVLTCEDGRSVNGSSKDEVACGIPHLCCSDAPVRCGDEK